MATASTSSAGSRRDPSPVQVALAGLSAVGVSYGFARYAPGLFAPSIRAEFGLSVAGLGLITSSAYVGYLIALTLVGVLSERFGPRPLVLAGGASASLGMAIAAVAPSSFVLTVGLVLAGTSSGWIWAPYSDVVDHLVPVGLRQRVLGCIPSGTAFGVAVSGPVALVASGPTWRWAWLWFAALALVVTAANLAVLRGRPVRAGAGGFELGYVLRKAAARLFLTALSYGFTGAVYWAFAVEVQSGDARATAVFWTVIGLTGTSGAFVGVVIARLGSRRTQVWLFGGLAFAIVLLAISPGGAAAVVSALTYGPVFMAISGLLAVWSYRVFPERPATGFSATVFFLGLGAIVGPAVMGAVAGEFGLRAAFGVTGGLAALTLLASPREASR